MNFTRLMAVRSKKGHTAEVLKKALEGVHSLLPAAGTELVHLYDLDFTGCRSCFACKRKGGASYGRCAVRDGLPPLLEKLADADGIIFGSPIYFMGVSGALRALLERLLSPFIRLRCGLFFPCAEAHAHGLCLYHEHTETDMAGFKLPALLSPMETFVARIFSGPEILSVCNTVQFDDYSKYMAERFSETDKKRHREEHFPEVLRHAFAMGVRMAERAGLAGIVFSLMVLEPIYSENKSAPIHSLSPFGQVTGNAGAVRPASPPDITRYNYEGPGEILSPRQGMGRSPDLSSFKGRHKPPLRRKIAIIQAFQNTPQQPCAIHCPP